MKFAISDHLQINFIFLEPLFIPVAFVIIHGCPFLSSSRGLARELVETHTPSRVWRKTKTCLPTAPQRLQRLRQLKQKKYSTFQTPSRGRCRASTRLLLQVGHTGMALHNRLPYTAIVQAPRRRCCTMVHS